MLPLIIVVLIIAAIISAHLLGPTQSRNSKGLPSADVAPKMAIPSMAAKSIDGKYRRKTYLINPREFHRAKYRSKELSANVSGRRVRFSDSVQVRNIWADGYRDSTDQINDYYDDDSNQQK